MEEVQRLLVALIALLLLGAAPAQAGSYWFFQGYLGTPIENNRVTYNNTSGTQYARITWNGHETVVKRLLPVAIMQDVRERLCSIREREPDLSVVDAFDRRLLRLDLEQRNAGRFQPW